MPSNACRRERHAEAARGDNEMRLRSITFPFTTALTLLALSGCPGDDGEDATAGETDTSTTSGPTTTTPDPDTTAGETVEPTSTTLEPTSSSDTSDTTTGEPVGLLPRVIEAIGGEDALGELAQVEIDATGSRFVPNEGFDPGGPASDASTFETRTAIDFDNAGLRIDIVRTTLFIPAPMPMQVSEIVDGDVGYVQGIESLFGFPTGDMLSDRWASTIKQQRMLNPHFVLKELLADPSAASEGGTASFDGTTYELLEVADPIHPITLWVDSETDLVARVTTLENAHLHRDSELDIRYADWQATADGVLFPNEVQLWIGGYLVHEELRGAVTSNPGLPAESFDLPPEATSTFDPAEAERGARTHQHNQLFASIGIPLDGLQTFVLPAEVAPGVWHLTGGSHHTMVVEQAGGLVVIDAPLYPQRCEAILDWIDAELGGAPVTHLVVSHHHEDHVSCARVFAAVGATVVVHETAEAFFDEIMTAPSTIEPDRLALNPVAVTIDTIPTGGIYVLDDLDNPITIYPLPSTHAVDLVLPFVESAGIAFTVDIFSPNFFPNPFGAQEVLDALNAAGITGDVNAIFGGHGFGSSTVAEVQAIAG
jgi:glyoxylase-like metal-dependent hydrolase (beta-lactamase superfamily II)